jgi:hypothetical protein
MPLTENGNGMLTLINAGLCDPDLHVLNTAIVGRINLLRAQANRKAARGLTVGDLVKFTNFTGAFEYANGYHAEIVGISHRGSNGGKVSVRLNADCGKYPAGAIITTGPSFVRLVEETEW